MKNFIKLVSFLVLSIGSTAAMANTSMSCYVDTSAFDEYRTGQCFAMIWGANKATAVFKVDGAPSGTKYIWSNSSCSESSSVCTTSIRAFQNYTMSATVLMPDGTWSQVQASASFEDGR